MSVASAGDVNGDGFSDVVVGAPGFDNGEPNEGRAFLVLGGTGLGPDGGLLPTWSGESNQADAGFGASVASAGDVNGDGFADVLVGAPGFAGPLARGGAAFLFHGSAMGLGSTPAWQVASNMSDARLGASVAGVGDVNGDGFADFVLGAPGTSSVLGCATLYLGAAVGAPPSSASFACGMPGDGFGSSVAAAGDVNGDGRSDVVVGAPYFKNPEDDEGRVSVFLGTDAGLATPPTWTTEGNRVSRLLGLSVASAGDVNGDGLAEVLAGASDEAVLFSGTRGGSLPMMTFSPTGPLMQNPPWRFGSSVAGAGDLNGDGFSDVIVGAPGASRIGGGPQAGRAVVYLGSSTGLVLDGGRFVDGPEGAGSNFGASVASAGDVNGDGFSDVVVGAPNASSSMLLNQEGEVRVLLGGDERPGRSLELRQRLCGAGMSGASPGLQVRRAVELSMRTVDGPAGLHRVRFEVEVRPVGVGFDGGVTQASALESPRAASVQLASFPLGRYHWRGRLRAGAVTGDAGVGGFTTRWVPFGANREDEPDFTVVQERVSVDAGVDAGTADAGPSGGGTAGGGTAGGGTAGGGTAGGGTAGGGTAGGGTAAGGDSGDAGSADGGPMVDIYAPVPCGCGAGPGVFAAVGGLLVLARRRPRRS
ncbi:MAG: FG-GAP repeat protein [Myxococcaceae bacterium]|nr:FG-GAP repeat protein [Myxococcaceae bacterium]